MEYYFCNNNYGGELMKFDSTEQWKSKVKRVIISQEEIRARLKDAGAYIDSIYDGSPILLVSILKGAFVFMADLCREVTVPCEIEFMAAKSYFEGTQSSGHVEITMDLKHDISDYHVIIVEDIIDTGRTLNEILKILRVREPRSLRVITLLDKPDRRVVELNADLSLFTIPDYFVIGYGLDYGEFYRNLPYIAEFEE
jgi:hypoxanthine phosphoribosyltransferase